MKLVTVPEKSSYKEEAWKKFENEISMEDFISINCILLRSFISMLKLTDEDTLNLIVLKIINLIRYRSLIVGNMLNVISSIKQLNLLVLRMLI